VYHPVEIQQCLRVFVNLFQLLYDFATPKHIVGYQEASCAGFVETEVKVSRIIDFIRIDEHDVEGIGERRDNIQRITDTIIDLVFERRLVEIAPGEAFKLLIHIDGDELAAGIEAFAKANAGITRIRADFQDAVGPDHPGNHRKEPSLHVPGEHTWAENVCVCFPVKRFQQCILIFRMGRGIFFDFLYQKLHSNIICANPGAAACQAWATMRSRYVP